MAVTGSLQARLSEDGPWGVPTEASPGDDNPVQLTEDVVIHEISYHRAPLSEEGQPFAERDREWLGPALMLEEMGEEEVVSPWLLRLELGNKKRDFKFEHIKHCILSQLKESSLQVLFNDDNSETNLLSNNNVAGDDVDA